MRSPRDLLIVGEDFGNSPVEYHNDFYALTGASGKRLAELAGVHYLNFYMLTERTNVVELLPQWRDRALVQESVGQIRHRMAGRRTILLGSRVSAAFGFTAEPLTWVTEADREVARMPHPSGRNHWWNDRQNYESARAFLSEAVARL